MAQKCIVHCIDNANRTDLKPCSEVRWRTIYASSCRWTKCDAEEKAAADIILGFGRRPESACFHLKCLQRYINKRRLEQAEKRKSQNASGVFQRKSRTSGPQCPSEGGPAANPGKNDPSKTDDLQSWKANFRAQARFSGQPDTIARHRSNRSKSKVACNNATMEVKHYTCNHLYSDSEASGSSVATTKPKAKPSVEPIIVDEQEVVNMWRTVGLSKGLSTDNDVARFLLTFYLGRSATTAATQISSTDDNAHAPDFKAPADRAVTCIKEKPTIITLQSYNIVSVNNTKPKEPGAHKLLSSKQKVQINTEIDEASSSETRQDDFSTSSYDDNDDESLLNEYFTEEPSKKRLRMTRQDVWSDTEIKHRTTEVKLPAKTSASCARPQTSAPNACDASTVKHTDTQLDSDWHSENSKWPQFYHRKRCTIQEFWTGKVQIQLSHKDRSHYLCEWCSTVFTQHQREEFRKHWDSCEKRDVTRKKNYLYCRPPLDEKGIEILRSVREKCLHCCDLCDQVFVTNRTLQKHRLTHFFARYNSDLYVCLFCSATGSTATLIRNHIRVNKHTSSECSVCGFQFQSHCQIKPHMKTHDDNPTLVQCYICGQLLLGMNSLELEAHRSTHTKSEKPVKLSKVRKQKRVLCPFCGKDYPRTSMDNHIRTMHSTTSNLFVCRTCAREFTTATGRDNHELTHGEKTLVCQVCGKKFFTIRMLKKHVNNKHSNKTFTCEECGRKLADKNSLQLHIKNIHQVKFYECPVCRQRLKGAYYLRAHMRGHSGEKPFACPHCAYRCKRQDYMKKHIFTHSSLKPFQCEHCPSGFNSVGSLKLHCTNHHKDQVYICPDCHAQFPLKRSLDYHRFQEHGANNPLLEESSLAMFAPNAPTDCSSRQGMWSMGPGMPILEQPTLAKVEHYYTTD